MGTGTLSSLLLLLLLVTIGDADMKGHFDPAKCRYALGMQDRTIPDSAISVSSSWSDSTAARHSRLESSDGDGAWCPAGPVFPKEEEYLQVDLRRLHLVALVGTQGRHAGGLGKEFSRSYRLRYSRDGRRWMDWKDRWGQEVRLGRRGTWERKPSCHTPYSIRHCPSSSISSSRLTTWLPLIFL